MRPHTQDEKIALLHKFDTGNITIKQFNRKHKLSKNAIYSWRYALKNTTTTTTTTIDTRSKLYEELKTEYIELETKLKLIHRRMQMIGENWD